MKQKDFLKKAKNEARNEGYHDVKYIGKRDDSLLYEPIFTDGMVHYIGVPQIIVIDINGRVTWEDEFWHNHHSSRLTEQERKGYTPKGQPVTDVPQNFKDWVAGHAVQIAAARERGTEPYFLKENRRYLEGKKHIATTKSTHTIPDETKRRRKEIKQEAKALLELVFTHPDLKGIEITISNTGIKEWLNQPHAKYKENR